MLVIVTLIIAQAMGISNCPALREINDIYIFIVDVNQETRQKYSYADFVMRTKAWILNVFFAERFKDHDIVEEGEGGITYFPHK